MGAQAAATTRRRAGRGQTILVAGIGNVFLGDDGFGVEVARRLASSSRDDGVVVRDVGVRCLDLAYELVESDVPAILVDLAYRGGPPGSVYIVDVTSRSATPVVLDGHRMDVEAVLRAVSQLGGRKAPVYLVGCEPGETDPAADGLSGPVAAAVDEALDAVRSLIARIRSEARA